MAGLGWWRETRKDKTSEHRADMDIVLSGFQGLLDRTDKLATRQEEDLAKAIERALGCEEREGELRDEVKALRREVAALRGAISGA